MDSIFQKPAEPKMAIFVCWHVWADKSKCVAGFLRNQLAQILRSDSGGFRTRGEMTEKIVGIFFVEIIFQKHAEPKMAIFMG